MDSKLLLAFVGGAVLASGIVFVAMKPDTAIDTASVKPVAAQTETVSDVTPAVSQPPISDETSPVPPARAESRRSEPRYDRERTRAAKPSPTPSRKAENRQLAQAIDPQPDPVSQAPARQDPAPAPASQYSQQYAQPAPPPQQMQQPQAPALPPPPPPQPHSVTLQAGTTLQVRLGETLTTKKNVTGDKFTATLSAPLVIDGFVIAERGARAEGRIVEADKAGKVKGVSQLMLELTRVSTSDGQNIAIHTLTYTKEGDKATGKDAAKVGGGAALGAIIGAIAGGGRGAAIGAGAGGAAGAGDVMLTRGPDCVIPVETHLSFKVQEPVTITERLN